ncbi:MAG: hypothetical protein LQ351_002882 [Letrouitia transgressa]|nr:MAG: hypothetical protein LQ351_002882 [Letrouitia transgressa]
MRSSVVLTLPLAALALAQSSDSAAYTNPFTSFLTQTNANGVITGQPLPATSQVGAATSQPEVVTTQPDVVTSVPTALPTSVPVPTGPQGIPGAANGTTLVPVGTGGSGSSASGTGSGSGSGGNSTVPAGTRTQTGGGAGSTGGATGGSGGSEPTGTGSSSGGESSPSPTNAAMVLQPVFGLGFAGALFAALL